MHTYEFSVSQRLTVALTFSVRARDRRHAEELIGRRMDQGQEGGALAVEVQPSEHGEITWEGDPVQTIRRCRRPRRCLCRVLERVE